MNGFEFTLELPRLDDDEALAIARDLSRRFAVNVTVVRVEQGRTFADADRREIVATIEPAT